jgi:hypothetical protein
MQFSTSIAQFQILIVGIIGFAGVMLTLWYNGKMAREQRWWEHKIEAYEKVIEALHNSKMFSEEHLEANYKGRDVPEDKDKELRRGAKLAHDEIIKVFDTGIFVLSENAMTRLRQYQKEADQASDTTIWTEYLEADLDATDRCLKDVIEIAKSDLKVK